MSKLPKSIIKKYGITKKAWQVFRGRKGKKKSSSTRKKTKTKVRYVAKKKGKKLKKFHKKMKSGLMYDMLGGVAYGAGRQWLSRKLAPITARIPIVKYADNIVMASVSWLLAKGKVPILKKLPVLRKVGRAGLVVESALLGVDLASKMNLGGGSVATTSGNSFK